jgi:hypothetical protein
MKRKRKKLLCKIAPQISVEQTKGNWGSYLYSYPFKDLVQIKFHKGLHVPID